MDEDIATTYLLTGGLVCILWWQTFPRLLNAGDLSLHFAFGPPTPTSAVLNLSKLDMFYMNKTPKRVCPFLPLTVSYSAFGDRRPKIFSYSHCLMYSRFREPSFREGLSCLSLSSGQERQVGNFYMYLTCVA